MRNLGDQALNEEANRIYPDETGYDECTDPTAGKRCGVAACTAPTVGGIPLWHEPSVHHNAQHYVRQMTTQSQCQSDTVRRMARPKMIQKTYRVSERLYEAAMAKAEEREEALSDIIRAALKKYVSEEEGK